MHLAAGEILKWSVKKKGKKCGQAKHFFEENPKAQKRVQIGCVAYGEFGSHPTQDEVERYKKLALQVISDCDSTAHCGSLKDLDRLVADCSKAMDEWPPLEAKHVVQARIIRRYQIYKAALPNCFADQ